MPTWIREIQAISSAIGGFGTAIIAWAGVRIARRQSETASRKLRLDLFPQRFKIFLAAQTFLADVLVRSQADEEARKHLRNLAQNLFEARFIFDKHSFECLQELLTKGGRYMLLTSRINEDARMDLLPKKALIDEHDTLESWFVIQQENLPKTLERQLKIDDTASFSSAAIKYPDVEK